MILVGLNLDPLDPPVGGDTLDDGVAVDIVGKGGCAIEESEVDGVEGLADCDRECGMELGGLMKTAVVLRQ